MMVGMVFAQYPVGWLLDHFRRATVIAGCSLAAALCCAILPWSLGVPVVFWPLLLLLGGTSFALYTGALTVLGERFRGGLLVAGTACFALAHGSGGAKIGSASCRARVCQYVELSVVAGSLKTHIYAIYNRQPS